MTRSGVSRSSVLVAGLVALVYASLVVMVSTCSFSHGEASTGHAHHDSHDAAPHNAFCAWACQSTSDAGLVAAPPALSVGPVVQFVAAFSHRVLLSPSSSLLHSRAPPSAPVVLLG